MIDQTNEKLSRISDSFYDDNDDSTSPASLISEIRIVTSKPPVYSQQNQNSNSPSPSPYSSEHDITDVSSINEQQQQQHSFHLQSMRHVLLGLSAPSSRPPSPAYPHQQQLIKKDVRILTDDIEKNLRHHYQQPYIHKHTKDHYRFRLTSSAINRQKQQQRIERENLKILERLQHIRPTRSLKRDELLSNYDRQMGFNTYPTEPHFRFPSRPSSAANMSSTFSISEKNRRTQSRSSSVTRSSNINSVRSRPVSASNRSSSTRQLIWNDRWQQQE